MKLSTIDISVARAIDPDLSAALGNLPRLEASVSVSVELSELVLESAASNSFEEADAAVSVEVIVAAGGFHHVVGRADIALVVFAVTVRVEYQDAVATSVVSTVVVQVDAPAVRALVTEERKASPSSLSNV